MEWKKFDYQERESGVFWCVVQSPDYDFDIDNDGRLVGGIVGTSDPVVRLCEMEYEGDGEFSLFRDVMADCDLGIDDGILLYAEVTCPNLPNAK